MIAAIAQHGSMAAAARSLDLVPSSLTYRVRQIEDALDVLLFDRSSRQAKPTAAGRELLREATRLLDDWNLSAISIDKDVEGALVTLRTRVLTEGVRYLKENAFVRSYVLAKPATAWALGGFGLFSTYSLTIYGTGDFGTSMLFAGRGLGAFISPLLISGMVSLTTNNGGRIPRGTNRRLLRSCN